MTGFKRLPQQRSLVDHLTASFLAYCRFGRFLRGGTPNDTYLKQQLALATYKGMLPDAETALLDACAILNTLGPQTTADPETLGLWGAVHKRLWEIGQQRKHLDEAIWAYEKGFYLKNGHYNGINLAFLLKHPRLDFPGPGGDR
jgi:hypothetical protein